ncbi:methylmalonyl Co-A mutase-associated GTPase MeaB [Flavobacteriaceae bacterium XHP0103]|uniref:methylmalonyl Co-A mutase-associated GTPase MeaB n=1 Tax=Marixanthotalea marina TaxID=2844359 RepID=UPI002989CB15|nr:methylmalonyl Co-A mutase-associated GTPase MeaB [Marixanthotalea marina]MBU3821367.1 methylmalonyl Co-A mutase-associated GTPase MeaB [Marixanthotalea marina]
MAKHKKSVLNTDKGTSEEGVTNVESISKLKSKREKKFDAISLANAILNKSITALSKAITLVESKNKKHFNTANAIIQHCLPHANKSLRIGISGIPGAGKSTFIEAFGKHLLLQNKRIAILTIDPTSTISKGSILGDKTRMQELAKNNNVFIRPSPSGDSLGGVAKKTRETILLCEAAGFDIIIIETVGVGQNETAVHSMVDFFMLLQIVGAGDELQGIKRGIIELADAIVINKADGDNIQKAKLAKTEFSNILHFYPEKESGWQPKVFTCSAINNEEIAPIWKMVQDYVKVTSANNYFHLKRQEQNKYWFLQTLEDKLKANFFNNKHIQKELKNQLQLLEDNKTTAFAAAEFLINLKINSD